MSSIVVNSGCAEGGVRLTGGKNETEGRVEVCHNQTWWAISGRSYYWDIRDATYFNARSVNLLDEAEICNADGELVLWG